MKSTELQFLKERYTGLARSREVVAAAKRTKAHVDEVIPKDPDARIQNYLDRFKKIAERDDPSKKARGIKALKKVLIDQYVVRVEDIPDNYWKAQLRVIRSRGESGIWEHLQEDEILKFKQEHLAQSKEDQQGSLEEWIDYLASDESSYLPDYLKYWVFASMLKLERYEKSKKNKHGVVTKQGRFPKRPTGRQRTIKIFPEVNVTGLKFIASAYKQIAERNYIYWGHNQDIPDDSRQTFLDALNNKDFRAAYGWVQEHLPPITDKEMQITEGENCGWRTFSTELGHTGQDVAETLVGKGTGWCIVGKETAQRNYLDQGANFHIYYTRDKNGNPANPRVVIVEMGSKITEVRGIEREEDIDDYIKPTNIIKNKLEEFPGGERKFVETDSDTKYLTAIDLKIQNKEVLTRSELIFLYEIDRPIKFFSLQRDPRIAELQAQRNTQADAPVVLDCDPKEISWNRHEVSTHTKAYIGPLFPGIFEEFSSLEYIYTSFPEGKITRDAIIIGTKDGEELLQAMEEAGVTISPYARRMIESPDFIPAQNLLGSMLEFFRVKKTTETVDVVLLKTRDLGFREGPTIAHLLEKAKEFGLELCPAEVGPQYRLQYTDQPIRRWLRIMIKPIVISGHSFMFDLFGAEDRLVIRDTMVSLDSDNRWSLDIRYLFSLRKNP